MKDNRIINYNYIIYTMSNIKELNKLYPSLNVLNFPEFEYEILENIINRKLIHDDDYGILANILGCYLYLSETSLQADEYFLNAIKKNNPYACYNYGIILLAQNFEAGFKYISDASKLGHNKSKIICEMKELKESF